MNPTFTLNYPEHAVAEYLRRHFTKANGYSVLVPVSSQQKGYDLALLKHPESNNCSEAHGNASDNTSTPTELGDNGTPVLSTSVKLCSKVATFQVKSSRTYHAKSGTTKLTKRRTFAHNLWLNTFTVPPEADFIVLHGLYAPTPMSTKGKASTWQSYVLLFTNAEMQELMASITTRTTKKSGKFFGFSFDHNNEAFLTLGHARNAHPDYSDFLLSRRHQLIHNAL